MKRVVLAWLTLVVAGCAGKAPTSAASPSASSAATAPDSPAAVERALEALDAGDLAKAYELLGDSHRPVAAPLAEAIRRTRAPADDQRLSPLLSNVRSKLVPRPPFNAAIPRKAQPKGLALRVTRQARTDVPPLADSLAALGDPLYDARGLRMGEHDVETPKAFPSSYGGQRLALALPQRDGRWLLLYGRGMGQARLVAIVDARTSSAAPEVVVLDCANLLEPPDVVAPKRTVEGIRWAELDGHRLYVSTAHADDPDASHGKNAYITAIDVVANAVLWQSEGQVASGGSFVLTDSHVVSAYDDYEYMRLFVLERETGKTALALPLPSPAHALWAEGHELRARALDTELTISGVPGLRGEIDPTRARAAMPRRERAQELPSFVLDGAAASKRTAAVARLDARRPLEAAELLRAAIHEHGAAGNFATEALLAAAERSVESARADAVHAVRATGVVTVTKSAVPRAAPVRKGAAFGLQKVSEAGNLSPRTPSIFDERKIPDENIDLPYPGHVGDLPDYVPARIDDAILFHARYTAGGQNVVAIYGGQTVLFDVASRAPSVRYDFTGLGADPKWPQVQSFLVEGDVVFAAGGTFEKPWLVAFDRKSGATHWMIDKPFGSVLLVDGWLVALTAPSSVVVLDPTTGAEVSRVPVGRAQRLARQGNEIVGGSVTSRLVLSMVPAKR